MTINRTFTESIDRYGVTAANDYVLDFGGGNDSLVTHAGNVTAYMGAGNDLVSLQAGTARIYGQAGADRFDVWAANAWIDGGADSDLFNIRGGSGHVFGGGSGNDRFVFLSGATNERFYGGDGSDYFDGNGRTVSGNLYGQAGNDRFVDFGNFGGATVNLYGGEGNDVYRIDPFAPATIIEFAGQGTDTVEVALGRNHTLGTNIENLVVGDFATVVSVQATLTGNGLNNRMAGSQAAEILRGMAGDDTLFGYDGGDTVDGGSGNDRLSGGLEIDIIVSGPGQDVIYYSSAADAPTSGAWGYEFIGDWEAEDMIDLSAIDANSGIAGNQAFRFAGYSFGTPVTDHSAGSLTIAGFGGELYIIANVDGDGIADFVISLWSAGGEAALTVDNLIL